MYGSTGFATTTSGRGSPRVIGPYWPARLNRVKKAFASARMIFAPMALDLDSCRHRNVQARGCDTRARSFRPVVGGISAWS